MRRGKGLICWYFNVIYRYRIIKLKVYCLKFCRNLLEEKFLLKVVYSCFL